MTRAELVEYLVFNRHKAALRFTQDSPIYPDVWLEFARHATDLATFRADLILTAHQQSSAPELFNQLALRLGNTNNDVVAHQLAAVGESVVAKLTFKEMLSAALPMTKWWQRYLFGQKSKAESVDYIWLSQVLGAFFIPDKELPASPDQINQTTFLERLSSFSASYIKEKKPFPPITLWSISRNRTASVSINKSVPTTKADAARRVFDITGEGITWAIIDSGVDASHDGFRAIDPATKKPYTEPFGGVKDANSNNTRILATYDFTKLRTALAEIHTQQNLASVKKKKTTATSGKDDQELSAQDVDSYIQEIHQNLVKGRALNWDIVAPLLRIPHNNKQYIPPIHPHGTHVAGIMGADLKDNETEPLIGMCPGIEFYDIRVLDKDGTGEEFNILGAIQFIRWLNNQKDSMLIHGANISISMPHEVASYACGQTPVCEACERMVAEGITVVVAAGNQGQCYYQAANGSGMMGYRMVNITDPGNADGVITVGATHRNRPHTYGVSYFSSKGPTGDGRIKPDLVAPGEKIVSTIPGNATDSMDGSSMAAPHVSGAAALLMAKHREMIGKPRKIKNILCASATDLGREKYFQGCGMIDVLRALQSV